MTDRHRGGSPRGFDRDRRPPFEGGRPEGGDRGGFRGGGERGGFDRPRPYGDRPPRPYGDRPAFGGRPPSGDRPSYGDRPQSDDRRPPSDDRRPPYREQRPPAPPEEVDTEFEDVDTTLAVAILDTATRLTLSIVEKGLPDDLDARREAVLEQFGAVYASILETVTSIDEEEEVDDDDEA